jgi:hypothetical protein
MDSTSQPREQHRQAPPARVAPGLPHLHRAPPRSSPGVAAIRSALAERPAECVGLDRGASRNPARGATPATAVTLTGRALARGGVGSIVLWIGLDTAGPVSRCPAAPSAIALSVVPAGAQKGSYMWMAGVGDGLFSCRAGSDGVRARGGGALGPARAKGLDVHRACAKSSTWRCTAIGHPAVTATVSPAVRFLAAPTGWRRHRTWRGSPWRPRFSAQPDNSVGLSGAPRRRCSAW